MTRLALKNPDGSLFRNKKNKPWTKSMINGRFDAIKDKTGVKLFPYVFRHTWCTNALKRGVDPLTVAIFLGHKDASMVMRVYNHLIQDDKFLAEKLKQATGEVA